MSNYNCELCGQTKDSEIEDYEYFGSGVICLTCTDIKETDNDEQMSNEANNLQAWTVTFAGHYPVGACAVVVAETFGEAVTALHEELEERDLMGKNANLPINAFEPLDMTVAKVTVILDGNY